MLWKIGAHNDDILSGRNNKKGQNVCHTLADYEAFKILLSWP